MPSPPFQGGVARKRQGGYRGGFTVSLCHLRARLKACQRLISAGVMAARRSFLRGFSEGTLCTLHRQTTPALRATPP